MRLPCAGAPWPSRAARTSHAPLAPPELRARPLTPRRARRSAPLTAVCAHCTSACTFFRHHTAPERDATGKTLHREARAAARRARRPPSTLSVTRAGLLCSLHAACTAALPEPFSPRAPRAPAASRLTRRRSCTARGARVARCARAPPSVQCAVQSACTQRRAHARDPRYMCTPRSPRTAMQPAPRDSRLPHVEPAPAARSTVRTVVSLSQKENKKAKQRPRPHRKRI